MKSKDYFIVGSKLFGIWCLFQGIVGVIAAIPTFIYPPKLGPEMGRIYMATSLVGRIIPVLFIVSGIYLLRGGNRLYGFAYPEKAEQATDLEWKFILFVKMLGIYLLVVYIPDLLRTASECFVYLNAPPYLEMFRERQFTYLNAAPSVGGVLLGIYPLRSGRVFIRMGLKAIQTKSNNTDPDKT
ncbi:MAG: hypothetical protein FJ110_04125 [Deltaproteobacteria bacterium]|nr:hypothetical protein [Deltaproteobacteria bacterium]